MKRTFGIVLAFILALTMSAVVLAEGLSVEKTEAVTETTEIVAETTEIVAETTDTEASEEVVEEESVTEAEEESLTEASTDPALSEEYRLFLYCLDHFHSTMWPGQEDDRCTLVIENRGEADGTITVFANYGYDSWYETGELEDREFASYGAEIVTISLPAGEKTSYTFDPGYWYNSMGYAIIGASYEDISYMKAIEGPVVNNLTLEEYLAQCTHHELVIK
ncbi:MAG: hypothetical protein J1E00_04535 [Oscillospiraceae bacterium]|nr:hypothetical protein [Oscillospiraceae bacterium]